MIAPVFDGDDGVHETNACGHHTMPGDTEHDCTTCARLCAEEDDREEARALAAWLASSEVEQ